VKKLTDKRPTRDDCDELANIFRGNRRFERAPPCQPDERVTDHIQIVIDAQTITDSTDGADRVTITVGARSFSLDDEAPILFTALYQVADMVHDYVRGANLPTNRLVTRESQDEDEYLDYLMHESRRLYERPYTVSVAPYADMLENFSEGKVEK
jgi:hypothetical protein